MFGFSLNRKCFYMNFLMQATIKATKDNITWEVFGAIVNTFHQCSQNSLPTKVLPPNVIKVLPIPRVCMCVIEWRVLVHVYACVVTLVCNNVIIRNLKIFSIPGMIIV